MLAVDAGEVLFSATGKNGKSCASCHGDGGSKLDVKQRKTVIKCGEKKIDK